jgi:hypothetical protein
MPPQIDPSALIARSMAARGMPVAAPDAGAADAAAAQAAAQAQDSANRQAAGQVKKGVEDAAKAVATGDKGDKAPVTIKFRRGEGDEAEDVELTESQVKGMFERYRSLNGRHATLKEPLRLVEAIMDRVGKDDPEAPQKAMQVMLAGLQALSHNPQMGGNAKGQQKPQGQPTNASNALKEWAKKNAIDDVTPFEQVFGEVGNMKQAMSEMVGLMRQLAGQSAAGAGAVAKQAQDNASGRVDLMKRRVVQNFDRVQAEMSKKGLKGFDEEGAKQFMNFAAQRGYLLEDFLDYDLLEKVATDYSNDVRSADVDRMSQVLGRRQAFSGSLAGAPSGGGSGGGAPKTPGQETFARLVDKAVAGQLR